MHYIHKVQYYETDQMGIVHHSNYIRWFEEARSYLLEKIGCGYKQMEEIGIISPVLSVCAEYKSMTRFYDEVSVQIRVTAYTGIKITLGYEIRDVKSGEIRCIGESRHCFLNREGRPVSLKKSYPAFHQIFCGLMENSAPGGRA
ncbi:MAG: acyl-CoA thioesterase [Roseburia sp.]|nr:acyl-CoA thioesterase [Roseburia sp.]